LTDLNKPGMNVPNKWFANNLDVCSSSISSSNGMHGSCRINNMYGFYIKLVSSFVDKF